MKERVTLTIDKQLLDKIDQSVDGTEYKNRSHVIELLLMKALSSNRPRKAIILAGGPSEVRCMMPVLDKPLIEWNIMLLKNHGVKDIIISIKKSDSSIKNYFGYGDKYGIKIDYIQEEYPLGTGGSIKAVSEFVKETTIVCNADELKDIDLDDMYEFHKHNNKTCTLALSTVDDPTSYGVAMLNGNRIVTFVEKPPKNSSPSKLVNAGLYLIEPEVLKYIPDGFSMLEQDVFPILAKEEKLFGYIFSGQWFPTKTGIDYEHAKKEWRGLK